MPYAKAQRREATGAREDSSIDLSIVIVSYNSKGDLDDLFTSFSNTKNDVRFEIIVVDNASTDGTREWLEAECRSWTIINKDTNNGFAAANNAGIQKAVGRYILLLNPDTKIHNHSLYLMIEFMDEHPDVGACGPRLLNPNGTLQRSVRRFPTLFHELMEMSYLSGLFPKSRFFDHYQLPDWDHRDSRRVDYVIGACLCVRREALASVGGVMDETYFLFYEETDLCRRLAQKGWAIWYLDEPTVTHKGGTTYAGNDIKLNRKIYYRRMDSRLYYHRKYGGILPVLGLSILFPLTGMIRLLLLYPFLMIAESKTASIDFLINKAKADILYFTCFQRRRAK